jgi:hypothetical protein
VSESLMSAAYSHSLLDCCRFNAQDACFLAVYRMSARGNCASCAAAAHEQLSHAQCALHNKRSFQIARALISLSAHEVGEFNC